MGALFLKKKFFFCLFKYFLNLQAAIALAFVSFALLFTTIADKDVYTKKKKMNGGHDVYKHEQYYST